MPRYFFTQYYTALLTIISDISVSVEWHDVTDSGGSFIFFELGASSLVVGIPTPTWEEYFFLHIFSYECCWYAQA